MFIFPTFTSMKTPLFLLFLLLGALNTFAAKPYTIVVNVKDRMTRVPLAGMQVTFKNSDKEVLASLVTDASGRVEFKDCTEKEVDIFVMDPANDYSPESTFFYRKYDEGEEVFVNLENLTAEKSMVAQKTEVTITDTNQVMTEARCTTQDFVIAEFTGGKTALMKYLQTTLMIPESALEKEINGKGYYSFIIDEEGAISNLKIEKGMPNCPECDMECIRVIAYMPNWTPATCGGEKVKVYYQLPISIRTSD